MVPSSSRSITESRSGSVCSAIWMECVGGEDDQQTPSAKTTRQRICLDGWDEGRRGG